MSSNLSTYRKYEFECTKCQHAFSDMMWINHGVPAGKACPNCSDIQLPVVTEAGQRVMINTLEDWTKKVPGGWSDFLTKFEKRHSKYDRTVNSHKRGLTEI